MELIVGIDEVGRGAWAGPVVAGAVILSQDIFGLTDSKLLSRDKRESLYEQIIKYASSYATGWVDPSDVDKLGMTQSVRLAMKRAIDSITCEYSKIIIDGSYNFLPEYINSETLIKADLLIPSVSAASILAKVERDRFMTKQDKLYPGYSFADNVGYGTKSHMLGLEKFGVTKIHRLSFKPIKKLII